MSLVVGTTSAGAHDEDQDPEDDHTAVVYQVDPGHGGEPPGLGSSDSMTAAELGEQAVRIASYSTDYGVSADEATRRLKRSDQLVPLLERLAGIESDRMAGWSIVHEPDFGAKLFLVGDSAPRRLTSRIVNRHPDIYLEFGASHTLEELEAAIDSRDVMGSLPGDLYKYISFTDIDIETNSIVIGIDPSAPLIVDEGHVQLDPTKTADRGLDTSARVDGNPSASDNDLSFNTAQLEIVSGGRSFKFVMGERTNLDAIYGGEHIDTSSGGRCTSGFAAKNGSRRGMFTAGHCGGITTHWRSRTASHTGSSYSVSGTWTDYDENNDFSYYETSQWESDNFYVSTSSTRDVTGFRARSSMNGAYVCHFGTSSGYSCGTVVSITHDPRYSVCNWLVGCNNIWIRVEGPSLKACGGDSGGPWFNWRTAYGIHSGSDNGANCSTSGTNHASFMAIDIGVKHIEQEHPGSFNPVLATS